MDEAAAVERVTAVLGDLETVGRYYAGSRNVGHTTAMLIGARESRALIVAADAVHSDWFRRQGLHAESRSALRTLAGAKMPLLVDHWALQCMITDARYRLEEATTGLVRELSQGQGQR